MLRKNQRNAEEFFFKVSVFKFTVICLFIIILSLFVYYNVVKSMLKLKIICYPVNFAFRGKIEYIMSCYNKSKWFFHGSGSGRICTRTGQSGSGPAGSEKGRSGSSLISFQICVFRNCKHFSPVLVRDRNLGGSFLLLLLRP